MHSWWRKRGWLRPPFSARGAGPALASQSAPKAPATALSWGDWLGIAALAAVLVAGAAVRLWIAIDDHSVFWPDEIYQSLEPAHRVVFGYGLEAWEFRDGARSWLYPGLLAGALRAASGLGVGSSLGLILTLRVGMALLGLLSVALGVVYARRLNESDRGLFAAALLVTFPALLVYSHRTLQEVASAPLVLGIPLLLGRDNHRGPIWAGAAAGFASVVRAQVGIVAAVYFFALLVRRRWADAARYAAAGSCVLLLSGVLDWFTWGRPFHSLIAYVEFNLVQGGSSIFGIEPPTYFLSSLWTSTGPLLLLVTAGFLISARKAPTGVVAVVAFIAVHSAIPHKEFRFLMPVLPLLLSLAGAGLAELAYGFARWPWAKAVAAVLLCLTLGSKSRTLTYADVGQYVGTERGSRSPWNTEEEPTLLLAEAGARADACGVVVLGVRAAFTGGFSYLHKRIPLIYRHELCAERRAANYLIAKLLDPAVPREYALDTRRGDFGLFKRRGRCAPPGPDYDDQLEGAADMGLSRSPVHQPDETMLELDAVMGSAAFTEGWGHGEHVQCRKARWATARKALVSFQLKPTDYHYSLRFSALPYWRVGVQVVSVSVNGRLLRNFSMLGGWQGYSLIVPRQYLNAGRNQLGFDFSGIARGEGADPRELAALFGRFELKPVDSGSDIDLGVPAARESLLEGFSHDERERDGKRTYVWSDGPQSSIALDLAGANVPHVVQIEARAYALTLPQVVTLSINGTEAGQVQLIADWQHAGVCLRAGQIRPGRNLLEFRYARTARPADADPGSRDERALGVMFDRIMVQPLSTTTELTFGTKSTRPHLLFGFGADDREENRSFVWNSGRSSRLVLEVADPRREHELEVIAQSYSFAQPQTVTLSVNGHPAGEFRPTDKWDVFDVVVPAGVLKAGPNEVEFAYSRTVRPREVNPPSGDERELAVRFNSLALRPTGE